MMAAPWRYHRILKSTVYAVTTRRVMIVNGLQWGSQAAVESRGIKCESFGRDEAYLHQVAGRRRDILLGGDWKRGRRNKKYWVHRGFLAADDPAAAELALRFFVASSAEEPTPA